MEELNETNELAISKVIEEISKGPIFEITLKDCFNAFTKNIALKKEMKEMSKLVQSNQDQTGQIKVSQLRINAIEEKNALLEKDLEEKSKTNKLIMEKYKKYKEQSEKFEKKLNELTEKHETETQAIKAEYEKMLKTAEAQMEKYEIEIDELKYYLHDNEKLNEWMKEEINKADNGNKDKEEMIRKLKRGNAELKNQLKDKNKDSSTLPTTHSDIKKLITFLKKFLPEINQDKLDQFLKTYEELHFCHLCKKQVSYTLDSRKKHAEGFHGSINDKLVYYKCFPGAREMCRCGQQYTKISQKDHVKTHHYDVKYKCIEKECDFNGVLSEIEMHIKESHTNINDNDAALIQLVSHCFDLSIPGKLDRKDLKDRKPSNDGLSVLEMKLEEVIKLSNKKDSNEINVHDTSPTKREYNPTFEEGMMTPAKENNDSTLTQDGDVTIESSKMSGTKSNSDKENGNIGLEEDNIELLDYGDFYEDPEKNVDEEEDVDMPENWSKFEFDLISIQNSDNEDAQELEVREVSSEKVERENKDGEPEKEAEEKEDTEKSLDLSKITDSIHTSENNAHTPQNKTRNVDFQTPEGRESRISRISRRDTSDHENYRSSLSKLFEHRSSREAPDFHSSKPNAYRDFDREDKRFSNRFRESYANGQRKRKYGSQSPTDENRQHPPKSFRVSVNENGVRYIGNHVVEHLRDKNFHRNHREPEIFTNQEIQRFLNEADQNMFCRYFYNQNCKYGPNCILIHDKYEITKGLREELIRWQKTKMSKVMENTSSSDMQKAIREAAPHKMCQWFKKFGKCRFGQGCWDVHDDREITVGLKKEIEKLHH